MRTHANLAAGTVRREVFYGAAQWKAHRSAYDKAVRITTPLTAGPDGSVYFGFTVTGSTPAHLDFALDLVVAGRPGFRRRRSGPGGRRRASWSAGGVVGGRGLGGQCGVSWLAVSRC